MLRKRKKQCKAAQKAFINAGLNGSPEEQLIYMQRMVRTRTPAQQADNSSTKTPGNQRPS